MLTKPNGNIRVYSPDRRAVKDIDSSHSQNRPELENPHIHDWVWEGDNPIHQCYHIFGGLYQQI